MRADTKTIDLEFNLQPVQSKLLELFEFGSETKIGFGGSRGGTKSHTSDAIMLLRRIKYPKTNGLLIMRVYQDMMDIHIRPMFETYPVLERFFNRQDMILKLPNGSYIRFLSGDNIETFKQRKGRSFADVMVDQSELFSQEEIEFFYTITRSTNPSIKAKILLCFNPGNIGHAYHKRIFYDKIYEKNEQEKEFGYLQTFGWDNAYWCIRQLAQDNGLDEATLTKQQTLKLVDIFHSWDEKKRFEYFIKSDYGRNLDGLPDSKRRAELLGDMEVFEGMFFSDFRYNLHIIHNYEITYGFSTMGGLDYGNTTVLEILQMDYEGTVVVADELYMTEHTNPSDRANEMADFLLERKLFNLDIIYDTDMTISQISNVGFDRTPIQIFEEVLRQRMDKLSPRMRLVNKTSLDRKKNYRQIVNEAVKDYLKVRVDEVTGKKSTRLYFSDKAKYLVKFITEAIFPPEDNDGMDFYRPTNGKKDHPYDAFKYPFMAVYKPKEIQQVETYKWLKEMLADMNKTKKHPMLN